MGGRPHVGVGTLGTTIRARRRELGWSQEELAARVSAVGGRMRQSDVSRLDKGRVTLPHPERLANIAETLGLPLGELLARSGWTGAAAAFAPTAADGPTAMAPPEVESEPQPVAARPADPRPLLAEPSRPTFQPWEVATPRLREAIERARETEARAAEILARSARIAELAPVPRSGSRRD